MDNFTNETLDTKQLPKYEEVQLALLHPNYKKVVYLNSTIITAIIAIGFALLYMQNCHAFSSNSWILFALGTALFCVLIYVFSILSFKKKGFAFRQHDVIYRSGIIATNTMVIPYNRVQHVALHEGILSRFFGLAKVEIFTAGGNASDLQIPGIEREEAEKIKQLLMGKIQKQL